MLYDVRLGLDYEYEAPVAGGHHLIRIKPLSIQGRQRVIAVSLTFSPEPPEQRESIDFFGNIVTAIAYRDHHEKLAVGMSARVRVDEEDIMADMSPNREGMVRELSSILSLDPQSPHHFLGSSPRVHPEPAITAYAGKSFRGRSTVLAAIDDLCRRVKADFAYDTEATNVDTPIGEAFTRRRGVCQDFTHIMIAGLRGLGIPAGYVSGFLRTNPPPGKTKLEGADAMHAWVRAWCGKTLGWREFDPTNAIPVGIDHIAVAYGRDYDDAAPIIGVLMTSGSQRAEQSVDVMPVK